MRLARWNTVAVVNSPTIPIIARMIVVSVGIMNDVGSTGVIIVYEMDVREPRRHLINCRLNPCVPRSQSSQAHGTHPQRGQPWGSSSDNKLILSAFAVVEL